MNKKSLTVPGYTLMEIVVAMILTAIAAGIFYYGFRFIWHEFSAYRKNKNGIIELLQFKEAIHNDVENCNYIVTENENDYFFVYENDTVVYTFADMIKRKKREHTDSFDISTEMRPTVYIDLLRGKRVVYEIHHIINEPMEILNITYRKHYSSEQLINVPQ